MTNPKTERSVRKIIDALLDVADELEHGEDTDKCPACKMDVLIAELDEIFK